MTARFTAQADDGIRSCVVPWKQLACAVAPDGTRIELRQRGHEYLILAGGCDLMSSDDDVSSRALADVTCAGLDLTAKGRILVGGLGMGYTLRAALDLAGPHTQVEVCELIDAVAEWNRGPLAELAKRPLDDPRTQLVIADVGQRIRASRATYDAILLDVDNGPEALTHEINNALYSERGLAQIWTALRPGGRLGVWSYADKPAFTKRLERQGFATKAHRIAASRKGRGRYHVVWVAKRR